MGSNSFTWDCEQARRDVMLVSDILGQHNAINPWVKVDTVADVFRQCEPCKNKRAKKCLGWTLEFRGRQALIFPSLDVEGRTIKVELSGKFCARRKNTGDWQKRPLRESSGAIAILEPTTDTILSRIHIDLATTTAQEHEPIWHIQVGGLPGPTHEKPETRWLKVPRLPSQPMDFPLLVELVLYNFKPKLWTVLSVDSVWRRMVKRAESLVLPHYFEHWMNYWNIHRNEEQGSSSWLAHQSNQTGKWSPWAI